MNKFWSDWNQLPKFASDILQRTFVVVDKEVPGATITNGTRVSGNRVAYVNEVV
jgi:hypothetical protein